MSGHLGFEFDFRKGATGNRVESKPFNVLVLGDFKGRGNTVGPRPVSECRIMQVDLDNADELWRRIQPELSFSLGPATIELSPRDLDHFHPDHLYRSLPVFREMREIRKRLLDPATSADTLAGLLSAQCLPEQVDDSQAAADSSTADSADALFERLLGRPSAEPGHAPATRHETDMLEEFIQRLVAPHIVHEPDPRADSAVNSLDLATADLMRQILHHPDFQAMEAAWRSLCDTVSGVEWDENLQLFVCDISRTELLHALPDPGVSLAESPLFELLVQRRKQAADDTPWAVITGDFSFGSDAEDIALLTGLGAAAAVHGGVFLGGASPGMLGCRSTADLADVSSWGSGGERQLWQSLRQSPVAPHIGLALPRVLLRIPYGKDCEEIDSFPFEEMVERIHEAYLWGNASWSCCRLLAEQFTRQGWAMTPGNHLDLGPLPAHSYNEDGESKLQPCAELLISESTMTAIFEQGLMPLISYRNQNTAVLGRFQSINAPLAPLNGSWERN